MNWLAELLAGADFDDGFVIGDWRAQAMRWRPRRVAQVMVRVAVVDDAAVALDEAAVLSARSDLVWLRMTAAAAEARRV